MNPDNDSRARLPLLLVMLGLALALFFSRTDFSIQFALERTFAVILASLTPLVLAVAMLALGYAVFPQTSWSGLSWLETALFAFVSGAAILSCLAIALGTAGFTSSIVTWTLVAICYGAAILRLARDERFVKPFTAVSFTGRIDGTAEAFLLIPLAVAIALAAVSAITPPILYDVTEYHLGALNDYLHNGGRIAPQPFNFFARFPFPVESLYFFGLLLDTPRDVAPKLLNFVSILSLGALMHCWLCQCKVARKWRMLAILLLLAHPVMLEVSLDAYIDAPTALVVCLGIYGLLICGGVLPGKANVESPGLIFPTALICGLAISAKYTVAQLYLLPVALFALAPAIRRTGELPRQKLIAAFLLFAIAPLFWFGKNFAFYRNPLEPFFEWLFRPADAMAVAREQFYINAHYPQGFLSASYWHTLPLRLGAFQWVLLAPLAGIGMARAKPGLLRIVGICAATYLLWNLVRESQGRFLLPGIFLLIVASAQILDAMPNGMMRACAGCVLALVAAGNLMQQTLRLANGGAFTYLRDFQVANTRREKQMKSEGPREAFYRTSLGAFGDFVVECNKQLPANSKLLLVYEARPYLFNHRTEYNTVFDASLLLELTRGATSVEEMKARLRTAGFTHVLVNRAELRRFIEQYARPGQLLPLGITDAHSQFGEIAAPEDLYPPFYRSPDWQQRRILIIDFLAELEKHAEIKTGAFPIDMIVSPIHDSK